MRYSCLIKISKVEKENQLLKITICALTCANLDTHLYIHTNTLIIKMIKVPMKKAPSLLITFYVKLVAA